VGKRNISPSPDPLPNSTGIKNKKKRSRLYNLQISQSTIYYINPELFGFHDKLAPNQFLPDNLNFERLRYSLNNV
jgi:hypothetical protein